MRYKNTVLLSVRLYGIQESRPDWQVTYLRSRISVLGFACLPLAPPLHLKYYSYLTSVRRQVLRHVQATSNYGRCPTPPYSTARNMLTVCMLNMYNVTITTNKLVQALLPQLEPKVSCVLAIVPDEEFAHHAELAALLPHQPWGGASAATREGRSDWRLGGW